MLDSTEMELEVMFLLSFCHDSVYRPYTYLYALEMTDLVSLSLSLLRVCRRFLAKRDVDVIKKSFINKLSKRQQILGSVVDRLI